MRDLKGYGRTPPDPKWPGGARVAVSFVINFEEGAEMSLSSGDAFDALWAEGERQPKMMSIGLHLRMIGRPGRIAALDGIVAHMRKKGGVWFATRRQIAEHWRARF